MPVELALTPDSRWDVAFSDLAAACGEVGYSALGVVGDRVDAQTKPTLDAAGLRCHEVLALLVDEDVDAVIANAERLARIAASISASWVLSYYGSAVTGAVADAVVEAAHIVSAVGVGLAVEFSPLGPVDTVQSGLEVLALAQRGGRAGLLIDTWHFGTGASTWEDLEQVPLEDIAYVQLSDARRVAGREGFGRALPGDGVLDLARFASTLLDRGWGGLVSVEVLTRELHGLSATETARRTYDAGAALWR